MASMMRRTAWIAVILLLSSASATVSIIESPPGQAMEFGVTQDMVYETTFEVDVESDVYFKILPLAGNPVNDGNPHGTVSNGEGQSGWWVGFRLLASNGELIVDLGDHVDTSGTERIGINGSQPYIVESTVHVPAEDASGSYEVTFAIVQSTQDDADGSGAKFEQSKSILLELQAPDDAPPVDDDDGVRTSTGSSAGGGGGDGAGHVDEPAPRDGAVPGWGYGLIGAGGAALVGGVAFVIWRRQNSGN